MSEQESLLESERLVIERVIEMAREYAHQAETGQLDQQGHIYHQRKLSQMVLDVYRGGQKRSRAQTDSLSTVPREEQ